jgi:formylglycine-generating enzyme required for sulfatase activity
MLSPTRRECGGGKGLFLCPTRKPFNFSTSTIRKSIPMNKLLLFIAGILLGLTSLAGAEIKGGSFLNLADMAEPILNVGGSNYRISHVEGGSETQENDIRDVAREDMPANPNVYWLRLSSNPWGKLLAVDGRPIDSITPVELTFDVMIAGGGSDYVIIDNYLWVREITDTYQPGAFSGKPITFQQKSLTGEPSERYPVFDLRRAKALNSRRVTLYNPDGTPHRLNRVYYNGETDLKGLVRFDRYLSDINDDKYIDIDDLVILSGHWMEEGFAVEGDISGPNGVPDGRVDLMDLAIMSEEWSDWFSLPFAYWKFDGDLLDSSVYARHGTAVGDPEITPSCEAAVGSGAVNLDGNDYIVISGYKGIVGTSARTCTAWINTGGTTAPILYWGKKDIVGGLWEMRVNSEGRLRVNLGGFGVNGSTKINTGQWVHVTALLPEGANKVSDVQLYINGIRDAITVTNGVINTTSGAEMRIGADETGKYFTGRIDDVRIYDRALTEQEIFRLSQVQPSQIPLLAKQPQPSNGAFGLPSTIQLRWSDGGCATSYDVYLGTSPQLGEGDYRGEQTLTSYNPGPLGLDVTYYWRVDAKNTYGKVIGNVWSFRMGSPLKAKDPLPIHGSADQPLALVLSWDNGGFTSSYKVYFGTKPELDENDYQGEQVETTFMTSVLSGETTYYWRIDPVNSCGTTVGDVWSFRTGVPTEHTSEMSFVSAGEFLYQNTTPTYLPDYYIGTYEVTNQEYCEFLNGADPEGVHFNGPMEILQTGELGSYHYSVIEGREDYPIRYVTYHDVGAFTFWLSGKTGDIFRLPTEEEWEKAAGWDPILGKLWTYGYQSDEIDCTWCNSGNCYGILPVGSFKGTDGKQISQSYYGCYDMSGNVYDMTGSKTGDGNGVMVRGGAYNEPTYVSCVTNRDISVGLMAWYPHVGFRIVREAR